MNQAGSLHRLQRIDSQIDQIVTRLAQIEKLLLEDERLQAARTAAESALHRYEKARLNLRSLEHLNHEQQVKIEQANATLYSGMVKNPKELQDLEKEIVSLKKYQLTLEEQQLQAMIEFEEAEQAYHAVQEQEKAVQAQVIEEKAGLAGERSQLEAKRANLEQERSAALGPITAANLETYLRIREQKHGIAVTGVEDDACSTCGAQIRPSEAQSARLSSTLVYCTSCGRILFAG